MNLISKEVMHVGEMASGAALTVPVYRIKGNSNKGLMFIFKPICMARKYKVMRLFFNC